MTVAHLFTPLALGAIALPNRVVMAPLTRSRAGAGNVPTELAATYYAQRASAGLIVSEATQVVPEGQGYPTTPGIHSEEQVTGWRRVTDAVHAAGGRMVLQLWHVGRVSHPVFQPERKLPVAPSAVPPKGQLYGPDWKKIDYVEPRALEPAEIPGIIAAYAKGAENAKRAGFDGVEVHGANGYLLDQFMRDSINDRDDAYGGPIAHRARLLLEVMRAVSAEVGSGRTGLRLSPVTPSNDAGQDSDPQALFGHVVEQLAPLQLAFLHVIEGQTGGERDIAPFDFAALRGRFKRGSPKGAWMVNNGYDRAMAIEAVAAGAADLVAFGRPFIANPDLVRRLREDAPLNVPQRETFYGGGAQGYTDYPTLEAATA